MRRIKSFAYFWYDFVIGDDWTMAAGVIVALGVTALLAHNNVVAWWLMPFATGSVLVFSLWRAGRKAKPHQSG